MNTLIPTQTYVQIDGAEHGPFEDDEVCARLSDGRFSYEDLMWRDGMDEWRPLSEFYMPSHPSNPPVVPTQTPTPQVPTSAGRLREIDDEIWSGKPPIVAFLGNKLGWAIVFWFAAVFLIPERSHFVLMGSVLIGIALAWLQQSSTVYTLTTTRVSVRWGLIIRSSSEMRVSDIRSINVVRSGLVGLCGFGDLRFFSAASGKAEVSFSTISNPEAVRDMVRRFQ